MLGLLGRKHTVCGVRGWGWQLLCRWLCLESEGVGDALGKALSSVQSRSSRPQAGAYVLPLGQALGSQAEEAGKEPRKEKRTHRVQRPYLHKYTPPCGTLACRCPQEAGQCRCCSGRLIGGEHDKLGWVLYCRTSSPTCGGPFLFVHCLRQPCCTPCW